MRVLMLTPEWPRPRAPTSGSFIMRQVESLRALGVTVDLLCYEGEQKLSNYVKTIPRMWKMMAEGHYDLIHGQFGQSAALALMQRQLPVVATYRGEDLLGFAWPGWKKKLKSVVYVAVSKQTSRFVKGAVVVSENLGRQLPGHDWTIIPSGLDLDMFRPIPQQEAREKLGWRPDGKYVLFSALDIKRPRKRYPLAQAAVEHLRKTMDVELKLAMDVQSSDMHIYMSAADTLLLCSANEGSPNVVKEAMACNLPVVSVDVGDVRERLTGVEPSAICDDTPEALAAGLQQVLQKGGRSNGRQAVADLADEAMSKRVIAVYERAIAAFRARS